MKLAASLLDNILFLDIETVSKYRSYEELDDRGQSLWEKKSQHLRNPDYLSVDELYTERAAIYAEFGKIICISVAYLRKQDDEFYIKVKSFTGEEADLLNDFKELLDDYFRNPQTDYICGHNIKEFDIPYICRRMVVHNIEIPILMEVSGKKPWQITQFLDTMAMWRFGDFKNYTSIDLLAYLLDVPSPKDNIDGSQVGKVYYEEDGLDKIVEYCEKDVVTVVQLLMRFTGNALVEKVLH